MRWLDIILGRRVKMKCSFGHCKGTLEYSGGENKEDHSCNNSNCDTHYIKYYGNVKVRKNWHYLAEYNLPFSWVSGEFYYYVLEGNGTSTILKGLQLTEPRFSSPGNGVWDSNLVAYVNYKRCQQVTLIEREYRALPSNQDFDQEFIKLCHYMMTEYGYRNWWGNETATNKHPLRRSDNIFSDLYNEPTGLALDDIYTIKTPRTFTVIDTETMNLDDIDSDTKRLIVLAAKNPNSEAGSKAAKKVCERLYKTIPSKCSKKD